MTLATGDYISNPRETHQPPVRVYAVNGDVITLDRWEDVAGQGVRIRRRVGRLIEEGWVKVPAPVREGKA